MKFFSALERYSLSRERRHRRRRRRCRTKTNVETRRGASGVVEN